jgi:general stress protein YciG
MDDIISNDDEKGRELAREKGRQDEKNSQRDRELATEKGRKIGLNEERSREDARGRKAGLGTGGKVAIGIICLVVIIIIAALLTLSVSVTNVSPSASLPFTTKYGVSFPEGQTITVGNSHINVLSYQDELISDIDGDRQKLVVGEDRIITERRAVIKTLGVLTLMDTNFQINLKYNGDRDNRAYFDMSVHTSRQVPDYLLNQLLPAELDARPI